MSSWSEENSFFFEGVYHEKSEMGEKNATRVKYGLNNLARGLAAT